MANTTRSKRSQGNIIDGGEDSRDPTERDDRLRELAGSYSGSEWDELIEIIRRNRETEERAELARKAGL